MSIFKTSQTRNKKLKVAAPQLLAGVSSIIARPGPSADPNTLEEVRGNGRGTPSPSGVPHMGQDSDGGCNNGPGGGGKVDNPPPAGAAGFTSDVAVNARPQRSLSRFQENLTLFRRLEKEFSSSFSIDLITEWMIQTTVLLEQKNFTFLWWVQVFLFYSNS